jgi:hypothetical protein
MLMNLNGRERTLLAFGGLFEEVSPRLRVDKVHKPTTGGELSLITAVVGSGVDDNKDKLTGRINGDVVGTTPNGA